jgi:hypothetical protein
MNNMIHNLQHDRVLAELMHKQRDACTEEPPRFDHALSTDSIVRHELMMQCERDQ